MKLKVVSIEKEGLIRVAAEGSITAEDFASDGVNPLQALLGQTWQTNRVLLSLQGVDYIDSSAVGWLIGTRKTVRSAGGALVVHSAQPGVRQIFDVLKVEKVVPLAANEDGARALLSAEGGVA